MDEKKALKKAYKKAKRKTVGVWKPLTIFLMVVSIIFDLVGMFAIGFDAFIPITIGATVLFVIGFLLRIFCP